MASADSARPESALPVPVNQLLVGEIDQQPAGGVVENDVDQILRRRPRRR